jgi:hypothetical protein
MHWISFTVIYINVHTLKNCTTYLIYSNMYRMLRKLRLSFYQKNQYRKKCSKMLLVSIPRDLIKIHPVSLPNHSISWCFTFISIITQTENWTSNQFFVTMYKILDILCNVYLVNIKGWTGWTNLQKCLTKTPMYNLVPVLLLIKIYIGRYLS